MESGAYAGQVEVAFPRCTATDKRCRRYSVDFGSPDSNDMQRPITALD